MQRLWWCCHFLFASAHNNFVLFETTPTFSLRNCPFLSLSLGVWSWWTHPDANWTLEEPSPSIYTSQEWREEKKRLNYLEPIFSWPRTQFTLEVLIIKLYPEWVVYNTQVLTITNSFRVYLFGDFPLPYFYFATKFLKLDLSHLECHFKGSVLKHIQGLRLSGLRGRSYTLPAGPFLLSQHFCYWELFLKNHAFILLTMSVPWLPTCTIPRICFPIS